MDATPRVAVQDAAETPADADRPTRLLTVASDAERGRALAASVAPLVRATDTRCVSGVADALTLLRTEPFDAVIAVHESTDRDPLGVDALTLARALRGAGDETPLAILGSAAAIDFESHAWAAGADEYARLAETTAEQLAGRLRRAIDARRRVHDLRRLLQSEQQRLEREREEAERVLADHADLVAQLQACSESNTAADATERNLSVFDPERDDALARYAAATRLAVIEGPRNGDTVRGLAEALAAESVTAVEMLERHLSAIDAATATLSPRASRHVRHRSDRLLVEGLVHLADAYRRRYAAAAFTQDRPSKQPLAA